MWLTFSWRAYINATGQTPVLLCFKYILASMCWVWMPLNLFLLIHTEFTREIYGVHSTGEPSPPLLLFPRYDEMDVGDIFVESMHRYEVDILNQGDIAVNYELVPNTTPFGSRFQFFPSSGRLEVDAQETIEIEFCPSQLGQFHCTFHWELSSNNKSACTIPISFKGNSVCPTFHFDVDRINFGLVSYGFLNCKTVTLSNVSKTSRCSGATSERHRSDIGVTWECHGSAIGVTSEC